MYIFILGILLEQALSNILVDIIIFKIENKLFYTTKNCLHTKNKNSKCSLD